MCAIWSSLSHFGNRKLQKGNTNNKFQLQNKVMKCLNPNVYEVNSRKHPYRKGCIIAHLIIYIIYRRKLKTHRCAQRQHKHNIKQRLVDLLRLANGTSSTHNQHQCDWNNNKILLLQKKTVRCNHTPITRFEKSK